MNKEQAIAISRSARWRRVGDEGVVLNQAKAEVIVVNNLGVRILECLSHSLSLKKMIDALGSEYDVESSVLETDISSFLDQLIEAGIIIHQFPDDTV